MENEKLVETVNVHSVEIAKLKEQNKNQDKDIVDLKDTQRMMYEMNTNIKLLVEKIGNTNDDLFEMKGDITGIKSDMSGMKEDINEVKIQADKKDAKKWDKLIWLIIGVVVTAIAGIIKTALGI